MTDNRVLWYRVEETTYSAGVDEWGDPVPGGPTKTNLQAYEVIRLTPKGGWVAGDRGPVFVNLSWRKRFAVPTVEEAVTSFYARKTRQIRIAQATIRRAEEAMRYLRTEGFHWDARIGLKLKRRV